MTLYLTPFAYDKDVPTNHRLTEPYHPAETLTTLIDLFIISPNVKILHVENIHLDFKYSDHNPVKLKVRLLSHKTNKTYK